MSPRRRIGKPIAGPLSRYHENMLDERVDAAVRDLVDRYRAQCLWFLRPDYYPVTPEDVDRVFRLIERYGDLDALRRVAAVRQWLSPRSSATSAGS